VQLYADLLAAAQVQNPEIASAQKMIEKQSLQVDLARKDSYPDFNVQYMWQRTGPHPVPRLLHAERRHKGPDLSQSQTTPRTGPSRIGAASCAKRAPGAIATTRWDLRSQYVIVQQTSELLKIHREGLVSQARSEFQAGIAAYNRTNRIFRRC